jgi:peptide/nickel transport system substrate-binding protein
MKPTFRFSWLLTLLVLFLGVGLAQSEKTLRVAIFEEPNSLNFMEQAGMPATWVDWNIYDQLVRYDYETNSLIPELALRWEQESPESWLVHLRPGVQFHKGYGEMTAEDVVFGINYILENSMRIAFLYSAAQVKSVEVVDKYTVRYNLNRPFTPFVLTALQGFGGLVLSKSAFEELGPQQFARNPVGTGPFEVAEWISGDRIVLKKHAEYWDEGYPLLDRVIWRFVPDATVRMNLLTVGEVDFVDNVPYKDIDKFAADPNLQIQTTPGWNWVYISFGDVSGPFADRRVRQAISYALDRQAIVDSVYFGHGIPAEKPLPPGFLYEDPKVTRFASEPDIERAKQLLAEAGYPNGFSSTIMTGNKEELRRTVLVVANQLEAIGINLQPQFMDQAAYAEISRKPGEFVDLEDITIMSPDPDTAVHWFWRTGQAVTRTYSNPVVDELILTAAEYVDPGQRERVYSELQELMLDESWFIYLAHVELVRGMGGQVTGYEITPQDMDIYFKYVDVSD